MRHNKYPEQILTCLLVSSWNYPFIASVSKGATSTIFTPLVWRGRGSNLRPPDPEADALPLELSGPVKMFLFLFRRYFNMLSLH